MAIHIVVRKDTRMGNEDWRQPGSGEGHLDKDSGGDIPMFFIIILLLCAAGVCFICVATA